MSLLSSFNLHRSSGGAQTAPITVPASARGGAAARDEIESLAIEVDESRETLGLTVRDARAHTTILRTLVGEAESLESELRARIEHLDATLARTIAATGRLTERLEQVQNIEGVRETVLDELTTLREDAAEALRAIGARVDRQAAQVQARASVMIDETDERLRSMRRKAQRPLEEDSRSVEGDVTAATMDRLEGLIADADARCYRMERALGQLSTQLDELGTIVGPVTVLLEQARAA